MASGENVRCGAIVDAAGVAFRVWAPHAQAIEIVFESERWTPLPMAPCGDGYFSAGMPRNGIGDGYKYRVDGGQPLPDPCSHYQPAGVHGFSMVVDLEHFGWTDHSWTGIDPTQQVFYELHIGAFTTEGTYAAAERRLPYLRELGITCIELMPVAEFAGERGWGYDGVALYAPYHGYGCPDDLKWFIDRAHSLGLAVILDVVYNHVGAEGNYLSDFSPDYFTDRHHNQWGKAINFYCEAVCDFVVQNAVYWVRDFHFDGLRLDAIQSIHDPNYPGLLARLSREIRAVAGARRVLLAAEDYLQRAELLKPIDEGGAQLDFLWNDDFHHAARVAVTGVRSGYFSNYLGTGQELLSTFRQGFLFQGQLDAWKRERRGSPTRGLPAHHFIAFIQNHDQVANTLYGARLSHLIGRSSLRCIVTALLLGTQTPLIFMGEEFEASAPFAYFADYKGAVRASLWAGRRQELAASEQYAGEAAQAAVLDPSQAETFEESKLDWTECAHNNFTLRLYRALLALRRSDAVLSKAPAVTDGAVLGHNALASAGSASFLASAPI